MFRRLCLCAQNSVSRKQRRRFEETRFECKASATQNQVSDDLSHLNSGPRTLHQCPAHSPYCRCCQPLSSPRPSDNSVPVYGSKGSISGIRAGSVSFDAIRAGVSGPKIPDTAISIGAWTAFLRAQDRSRLEGPRRPIILSGARAWCTIFSSARLGGQ
jgi:hypothetical protein